MQVPRRRRSHLLHAQVLRKANSLRDQAHSAPPGRGATRRRPCRGRARARGGPGCVLGRGGPPGCLRPPARQAPASARPIGARPPPLPLPVAPRPPLSGNRVPQCCSPPPCAVAEAALQPACKGQLATGRVLLNIVRHMQYLHIPMER